ncbi:hypothetical protein ACSBR2_028064 [Camellia fascicularis]
MEQALFWSSHYQAQAQACSLLQNMTCPPKPWRHRTTRFDSLQRSRRQGPRNPCLHSRIRSKPHNDIYKGNLHFHFIAYDHGSVNYSLAFDIFHRENLVGEFDYVHTESELLWNPNGHLPEPMTELQEAMSRLVEEIGFFISYTQHVCISNSAAAEALVNIYQLPQRNVHVILNGVSTIQNSCMTQNLVQISQILGSLELTELSEFYKALDVFVNPTLRPHGLDLTLIEPMHCGKPVLVPNFPSIMGTLVLNEGFGYTFSPNVKSFVEALESAIRDGIEVLKRKGLNYRYCQYPRPTNC